MASITYSLSCGVKDKQYYGGNTFSATITRNDTPPSNAIPQSAVIKFTDICVGSAREPYLEFGDYFTTDGLPQADGFLEVGVDDLSSSILDVTSATVTVTIKGLASNLKAFDFNKTAATLVVEYTISSSTSSFSLGATSIDAGKSLSASFSNSNLSSVYHKVKWAIGSNSYEKTTSYGASSASYTIPLGWLSAIPNSLSGTGTVTVSTYSSGGLLGTSSKNFT